MKRYEFKLTGFSEKIFKERYAIYPEETWEQASRRVASHVAGSEKPEKIKYWEDKFYNEIVVNKFLPGGRILYGSQRPRAALGNCFALPAGDSREEWGELISNFIVVSGLGGGVGINFSTIRPSGTPINGTGGKASGAVSLMRIVDAAAKEIKDGGSRRAAALFALNIDHPDIEQFISEKLDKHKLNSANMSVFFDKDPDLFFDDVKHNREIELKWGNKVVRKINAKEVWLKLISNAIENGEPGLLNGYYINKMNNTYYYEKIISLNACSEIPLEKMNMCVLGSLVLPRFVNMDNGEIDWDELGDTIATSIRFLDDVISVNFYPLTQIEQTVKSLRRIGFGVIGLYDMLVMCGYKYGSEKSLEMIDKLFDFIKTRAYETSVLLAVEKGTFPVYEQEKYMKSEFVKGLKHGLKSKIKDYGIRNASLLSLQPTGTTGLLTGFSGGIEPILSPVYKRTFTSRKSDKLESEYVVNKLFLEYIRNKKDLSNFVSSSDLSMEDHLLVQISCQKHIDNAISKTIIIKNESVEEISKIIMKYFNKIKGLTIYKPGSRKDEPLQMLNIEESKKYVEKHLEDKNIDTEQDGVEKLCKDGYCDLR